MPTLSAKLVEDYGSGFSVPNLSRMHRFAECYSEKKILSTVSKELSWTHYRLIFRLESEKVREYYLEEAVV